MKRLAIIATILGAASVAAAAEPARLPRPGAPQLQGIQSWAVGGDANRGQTLVIGGAMHSLRFTCAQCHGVEGTGDPSGAFPRLTGQSAWYLYSALHDFATGLRPSPIMGPVAIELSDRDMQDLAAYFASIPKAPYPPSLPPDKALVQQGAEIASAGIPDAGVPACRSCHGPAGIGSPPLYPWLAGQFEPYLEGELQRFKSGQRAGDPGGVMRTIASKLTDHQIQAVATYFASLRPAEVNPGQIAGQPKANPPKPLPMRTGAMINLKPSQDKTVLPGAGGQ